MWMICVVLMTSIPLFYGQTFADYKKLYTDKFANHQTEVIPKVDANTPLVLESSFFFMTLGSFDELDETIVVLGGVQLMYNDPDLLWDPTSYGGIIYTSVPNKNVWKPPLTLVNAVDVLEPVGSDTEFVAMVTFDGNVSMPFGGIMKAKCTTDIFKFPYDTQKCALMFSAWGYMMLDAVFNLSSHPISLDFFTPNSNWRLVSISGDVRPWNQFSIFDIHITIKRESLYYTVIMVCPTIVFGLLNPLVFLLPVESGERIGLAMTILLSYAIFLTIVSASIPASSNPMSFLLLMMIVTIVVSGIIVVKVILITSLYYKENNHDLSNFWKFFGRRRNKISKLSLSKWKILDCKNKSKTVDPISEKPTSDRKDSQVPKTFLEEPITWKDVSRGLDYACVVIDYIIFISIICVYFTVAILSP